jgi:F0F1-type ATP synthase assembly protein I
MTQPSKDTSPDPAPPEGRPQFSRESDDAWRAFAYLLSGPLTFGGIGWLIDRWAGTGWLLPVGIIGGMALSLYLIWFRYGTH